MMNDQQWTFLKRQTIRAYMVGERDRLCRGLAVQYGARRDAAWWYEDATAGPVTARLRFMRAQDRVRGLRRKEHGL